MGGKSHPRRAVLSLVYVCPSSLSVSLRHALYVSLYSVVEREGCAPLIRHWASGIWSLCVLCELRGLGKGVGQRWRDSRGDGSREGGQGAW